MTVDKIVDFIREQVGAPAAPAPLQISLPPDLLHFLRQQQMIGHEQTAMLEELILYYRDLKDKGPSQAQLPPELYDYFQQHHVIGAEQIGLLRDLTYYLQTQQPAGPTQIELPPELIEYLNQLKGPPTPTTPTTTAAAEPQIVLKKNPKAIDSFNKTELELIAQSNNITFKEADPSKKDIYTKLLQLGLIPVSKRPTPTISGQVEPPRRSARLNPDLSTPTDGSGLGVHLKKLPKVIKLGHIHINPSNLYYEHILSVRNPKNKPLRAYKDEQLSDYLASLIIKLVEGGNIKKYELQQLSNHEMMIYDNLIKRSKLHTMNDNTFETTAGKMKQRLEV